jgi:hypothetical protein
MVKKKMIEDFFELMEGSFTFYKNNKMFDKLTKQFYNEIKKIKPIKIDIDKKDYDSGSLSESHFVDEKARKALKKIKYSYASEFNVLQSKIHLNLLGPNTTNAQRKKRVNRIYKLLYFIISHSKMNLKTLKITLFFNKSDKKITKKYETLSPKHINTAVTYACATNGEIFLYRNEEWFKVLAHELMHSLCLDFSGLDIKDLKDNFKKLFKLNSNYEISESYAEFWATIINVLFLSYDITSSYKSFKENVAMMLDIEKIFSLYQVTKILKYMKIDGYENLIDRHRLYEEKTNVFAYYIVKTILLYHYDDFLSFCHENNPPKNPILFYKSPRNLSHFFDFILKYYNDEDMINDFRTMKLISRDIKNNDLKKSMRMTLFEKN